MHLLNTTTLKLHEFFGTDIPYYAILSHRWGNDEVSFQDLQQGRGPEMAGWAKIVGCCVQALKEGWEYAWIDSCCIEKSSSSELSEAINSMFQWYKNSQVCYAYLNDVPVEDEDHEKENSAFRASKWFTRGWTLQELLAPQTVVFFNHGWAEIGTRTSLGKLVSSITNIAENHLRGGFERPSTAQKFSWASRRQTLRIEDTAYCLMGLFDVNMPLLYGEGNKAFMRLQLEIIKVSDDDSLFAWIDESACNYSIDTGLLANSPSAFQQSGNIYTPISTTFRLTPPYSMTNQGLKISLMLIPASRAKKKGVEILENEISLYASDKEQFFAPLSCYVLSQGEEHHILLRLGQYISTSGRTHYIRLCSNRLHHLLSTDIPRGKTGQIFVPQGSEFGSPKMGPQISKLAIIVDHVLNKGFFISSIIHPPSKVSNLENLRSCIQKWDPLNSDVHERTLILNLRTKKGAFGALVEFKSLSGPTEGQDAFILQIYLLTYDSPYITLNMLHSNGRSLDEVFLRRNLWNPNIQSDRASMTLPSGLVITAAARTRLRDGELVYAVDVHTKPSSRLSTGGVQR